MTTMNVQEIEIDKVIPYARNPRKNDKAVDMVMASLKEFGFQQPIVVDEEMVVIVGHTRLKAAKKLGYKKVPVQVAKGLTDQQVKAYRIMDNKSNEQAEWDTTLLTLEYSEIDNKALTGFTQEEIDAMIDADFKKEDLTGNEDDVPEVDELHIVSQMGDVWVLGNHKLIYGSSTESDTYDKLLGKEKVDLIWTDPPYNVAYQSPAERRRLEKDPSAKKHLKIQNDNMESGQFAEFLNTVFKNAATKLKDGGAYYVSFSDIEGVAFRQALKNNNMMLKQTLTWVKDRMVFGRQDYHWASEPILYGWKEGAAHYFINEYTHTTVVDNRPDFNKMTKEELVKWIEGIPKDVIDCPKPHASELHPTMKPVELLTHMIRNSSRPKEIVMDMFGGSGSTLIACEVLGRKARLIELEGKYVDVIVRRWQEYTGKTAILEGTGKTFEQIALERME